MSPTKNDSRWLTQTKRGGLEVPPEERGDCVPACMASILGLPLDTFHRYEYHTGDWWERLQDALAPLGYCLAQIDLTLAPPLAYWIAVVPSLNLPPDENGRAQTHVIVCREYDLVHDPSMAVRYDDASWTTLYNEGGVREGWVLVQRDPAAKANPS